MNTATRPNGFLFVCFSNDMSDTVKLYKRHKNTKKQTALKEGDSNKGLSAKQKNADCSFCYCSVRLDSLTTAEIQDYLTTLYYENDFSYSYGVMDEQY